MGDNNLKNVLFIVDTSGSLYSQKISAVNAALVECVGVIRTKIREGSAINVYYSSFDEKMTPVKKVRDILNVNLPNFTTTEENGFYKLTLFEGLYDGLLNFFEKGEREKGQFLIILITDGKAIDSMKYEAKLYKIKNIAEYRETIRVVAQVEGDKASASKDLFEFVDNNAGRIVELSKLANEIDSIMVSDSSNYLNIFN